MMRVTAILAILAIVTPLAGCYNTYAVPSVEFRKLQSRQAFGSDRVANDQISEDVRARLDKRGPNDPVAVRTTKNQSVMVTRNTKIFVKSRGGRRYQLTPFNFSMNSSQLVASDRDTLLPLSELGAYEVDLLSNGKTIGVISVGVAAAVGFIAVIIATAGSKSFNDE